MCGRFTLTQPAYIAAKFGLDNFAPVEPEFYEPRFNVAPTQRIVVIPTRDMQREARRMRWGLIPSWAKDASIGSRLINARAEDIDTKASFRAAFKYRRCLIPADSFYEWLPTAQGKQPYRVMLASGELFAFAGLWERWKDPQGESVESCCIVTCVANELAARFHDRNAAHERDVLCSRALSGALAAEAMDDAALRREVTRGGARCGASAQCGGGRGRLNAGWDAGTALAQ